MCLPPKCDYFQTLHVFSNCLKCILFSLWCVYWHFNWSECVYWTLFLFTSICLLNHCIKFPNVLQCVRSSFSDLDWSWFEAEVLVTSSVDTYIYIWDTRSETLFVRWHGDDSQLTLIYQHIVSIANSVGLCLSPQWYS